ncbi:MAG: 5-(carboxyamino)imidazole ribonucleotide mutase [Lentisphaeraceae bacterium]|nr:5-(carboxyamino)imidazole ribonucleotide mutase [Lentisphaeraceae bacterium]
MDKPLVGIIMGSDSDWSAMQRCVETLKHYGVPFEAHVMSAHRTPERAAAYAAQAEERGLKVLICAAGMAAHLAGVIAGHTTLPVIGVPMKGGAMDGLDALLATVQMPGGIPVATVALGNAGATNAAVLAVQMLALSDAGLRAKLHAQKAAMEAKVAEADAKLQTLL